MATNSGITELLVEAGAIHAICLQLGYILNKENSTEELEQLCRALHLLCRCTEKARNLSLREIGNDLITLLLKVIARANNENIIHEVVATWQAFSGSGIGALALIRCNGLLSTLVEVLLKEGTKPETITEALGLIKNLTYYAEDHRQLMLEKPGLLTALIHLPFTKLYDKCMERLSGIFRNLAISPNSRLIMAQQPNLLSALIRLSSHSNPKVTRNILSTITSLTMEADSCVLIALHGEGIILDVLSRLVSEDADPVIRRRAARALRFLARDKAAMLIVDKTVHVLSQSAIHDHSREVRIEAAEAFASCAVVVQAQMPHHDAVLSALTNLATDDAVMPDVIARVLKKQAIHPQNRVAIAKHDGLLPLLARIALSASSSLTAKEDANRALKDLSAEESNREIMATTTHVLAALVKNSLERQEETRLGRDYATRAIVNLASLPSNMKRMVTHAGLLKALVQYAATANADIPTKSAVKKVILMLVPHL